MLSPCPSVESEMELRYVNWAQLCIQEMSVEINIGIVCGESTSQAVKPLTVETGWQHYST